jgi:hypothetical protein
MAQGQPGPLADILRNGIVCRLSQSPVRQLMAFAFAMNVVDINRLREQKSAIGLGWFSSWT